MLRNPFEKNISKETRSAVLHLLSKLQRAGFQAYLVGGCVRDLAIGHAIKDIDITTNARPEQIQKIFKRTVPTGIKHGTITVLIHEEAFEVTTYRSESDYSDGRRPDSVTFSDTLEADLSRRDFTMNALAYNPNTDELVDLFNGLRDLQQKTIRTIGNPLERFFEDGLRPVRACRFSATLNFEIEPETYTALSNAEVMRRTKMVAVERFSDEFWKAMQATHCLRMIDSLIDTGLLFLFIDKNYLNIDRLESVRPIFINITGCHRLGRAALLFYAITDTDKIERIGKAIKFSNQDTSFLLLSQKILAFAMNKQLESFVKLLAQWKKNYRNKSKDELEKLRPVFVAAEKSNTFQDMIEYLNTGILIASDLAIDGNDLKQIGFTGKTIGILMEAMLETMHSNPNSLQNEKKELLTFAKNYLLV